MTTYYLQVLKDNVSICLDTDIGYHHQFKIGDIINIHMYPDKGPKVVFGDYVGFEYDAEFTLDWTKTSSARLTIDVCITKGYLADVTKQVDRNFKLEQLGL